MKLATFFLLASLIALSPSAFSEAPFLEIPVRNCGFGEVYVGARVENHFLIRNVSDQPVEISRAFADVEGARVLVRPRLLEPGADGWVDVELYAVERLGEASYSVVLLVQRGAEEQLRKLSLSGFVESAFDPEEGRLDYGGVERASGTRLRFEVFSREVDRLEIAGIERLPGFLRLEVAERIGVAGEGVAIVVDLEPNAPLGLLTGAFQLRTNVPRQPSFWVRYLANVFEDIVPDENPVSLGMGKVGETLERTITLRSRKGTPFQVDRVENLWVPLVVDVVPCPGEPASETCRGLRFLLQVQPGMQIDGTLRVFLKGTGEPIPISYRGLVRSASSLERSIDLPGVSRVEPPSALPEENP